MKLSAISYSYKSTPAPARRGWGRFLALAPLLSFLLAAPAHAVDAPDPFEVDRSGWMSLERYTDRAERFPQKEPVPEIAAPEMTAQPDAQAAAAPADAIADPKKDEPTVAEPTRPLNFPVLPGVNRGYDVRVSSTEEDNDKEAASIVNLDKKPELAIHANNWLDATTAANNYAVIQKNEEKKNGEGAKVRLAAIPGREIKPLPAGSATYSNTPHVQAVTSQPDPAAAQRTAEPARNPQICNAITTYKKRQLQAIESDRKTLAALQAAINELGLNKELNFIAGASGLNTQTTEATKISGPMDFPPAASATKKN